MFGTSQLLICEINDSEWWDKPLSGLNSDRGSELVGEWQIVGAIYSFYSGEKNQIWFNSKTQNEWAPNVRSICASGTTSQLWFLVFFFFPSFDSTPDHF